MTERISKQSGICEYMRGCQKTSVREPARGSRKLGGDKPLPYEDIFWTGK